MPDTSKASTSTELPVTLLSGFLGAGKTTLLNHVLREQKDYKVAVIVNDMAELNIDAKTVQSAHGSIFQQEEQFVQFENGCICCTLRADLLQAIASIADAKTFDLVLIESTGISEPMQVAETFALAYEDENLFLPTEEDPGSATQLSLKGKARLDTCVTVVDAVNFFLYFDSTESVCGVYKDAEEEDDRNIVDLMVDQIEFSNVIIVNKIEKVSQAHLQRVLGTIKSLNPKAVCVTTSYSKIDVGKIMNTQLFDYDEAVKVTGWLLSLKEDFKSETEEYGVSSFVYRQRKPFHPQRLWDLLSTNFIINQMSLEEEEKPTDSNEDDAMDESTDSESVWKARQAAKEKGPFAGLLRSKGFLWVGARDELMGCWSQAGIMVSIGTEQPWFAVMDPAIWESAKDEIMQDFAEPYGDRRQEIVFIGFDMQKKEAEVSAALDACLCTEAEMKDRTQLSDPFEKWVNPFILDDEEDADEDMACPLKPHGSGIEAAKY